ncbi:hypothetical protein DFS33DRAFT_955394 [Desarmillaria ectypa]|nr:hypothetical protein DFS33DRAFT_955394 [Desarmillaria ectypa]
MRRFTWGVLKLSVQRDCPNEAAPKAGGIGPVQSISSHGIVKSRPAFHTVNNYNAVYARFNPSNKLRKANTPPELYTLEIMPAGQAFFDDILMSVLLIEQQRLCPRVDTNMKNLFNFKLYQRFKSDIHFSDTSWI